MVEFLATPSTMILLSEFVVKVGSLQVFRRLVEGPHPAAASRPNRARPVGRRYRRFMEIVRPRLSGGGGRRGSPRRQGRQRRMSEAGTVSKGCAPVKNGGK